MRHTLIEERGEMKRLFVAVSLPIIVLQLILPVSPALAWDPAMAGAGALVDLDITVSMPDESVHVGDRITVQGTVTGGFLAGALAAGPADLALARAIGDFSWLAGVTDPLGNGIVDVGTDQVATALAGSLAAAEPFPRRRIANAATDHVTATGVDSLALALAVAIDDDEDLDFDLDIGSDSLALALAVAAAAEDDMALARSLAAAAESGTALAVSLAGTTEDDIALAASVTAAADGGLALSRALAIGEENAALAASLSRAKEGGIALAAAAGLAIPEGEEAPVVAAPVVIAGYGSQDFSFDFVVDRSGQWTISADSRSVALAVAALLSLDDDPEVAFDLALARLSYLLTFWVYGREWKPVAEHIVFTGLPADARWGDLRRLELNGTWTPVPPLKPADSLPSPVHADLMIQGCGACTYALRICNASGACPPTRYFTVKWTGSEGVQVYDFLNLPTSSPVAHQPSF